jgi:hypothetical protein
MICVLDKVCVMRKILTEFIRNVRIKQLECTHNSWPCVLVAKVNLHQELAVPLNISLIAKKTTLLRQRSVEK